MKFYYDLPAEVSIGSPEREMLETMFGEMNFFLSQNLDGFCRIWKDEILSVKENIPREYTYSPVSERIYDLCCRHYGDMQNAFMKMWGTYASPWASSNRGTFFQLLEESSSYKPGAGSIRDTRDCTAIQCFR